MPVTATTTQPRRCGSDQIDEEQHVVALEYAELCRRASVALQEAMVV